MPVFIFRKFGLKKPDLFIIPVMRCHAELFKIIAIFQFPATHQFSLQFKKSQVSNFPVMSLIEEIFELLAAAGMAELTQRLGLDLADALACDIELLADLFKRARTAVLDAEAEF